MSTTGRCLCGAIKYKLDNAPSITGVCHCLNCQRQTGSAFSTLAAVSQSEFHLLSGSPKVYKDNDTGSGDTVERYFCGDCGSPIYSVAPSIVGKLFLKTGTLDDKFRFEPLFHVWCYSKQNWVELKDDVPSFSRGRTK